MNKLLSITALGMIVAGSAFAATESTQQSVPVAAVDVKTTNAETKALVEPSKVVTASEVSKPVVSSEAVKEVTKPKKKAKKHKKTAKKADVVVKESEPKNIMPKQIHYGFPVAYNVFGFKIPVSYTYPDVKNHK